MHNENLQFRMMYVVGIVLVVASHCGGGGVVLANNWFTWTSFFMELFFFCSGYFYRDENADAPYIYIYIQK